MLMQSSRTESRRRLSPDVARFITTSWTWMREIWRTSISMTRTKPTLGSTLLPMLFSCLRPDSVRTSNSAFSLQSIQANRGSTCILAREESRNAKTSARSQSTQVSFSTKRILKRYTCIPPIKRILRYPQTMGLSFWTWLSQCQTST